MLRRPRCLINRYTIVYIMRTKNRNSTSTRYPLLHGLARLPDFFLSPAQHVRGTSARIADPGSTLSGSSGSCWLRGWSYLPYCALVFTRSQIALACCRPGARRARQGPARLAALPEKAARWHKASGCAGQRITLTDTDDTGMGMGMACSWQSERCVPIQSLLFSPEACQQTHHQPCLLPWHHTCHGFRKVACPAGIGLG